jgi:hypothetical protein
MHRLTPEQIEEADSGEFATDEETAELWKKCGVAPSGEQHRRGFETGT